MKHGIDSAAQNLPPPPRVSGFRLRPTALSLALAGLFAPSGPVLAATINVGGTCSLANAINAANNDAAAGGCNAGSGDDTIVLAARSTITLSTSLPNVTSNIAFEGNNATVTRSPTANRFPIFRIDRNTSVSITKLTISGGSYDPGGIDNEGNIRITESIITGNTGSGIENLGSLTLDSSTVSNNTSVGSAGGISNSGTMMLTNSTVSGNTGTFGGIRSGRYGLISDCIISRNHATYSGGGISNDVFVGMLAVTNSEISENSADRRGGGIDNFGDLHLDGVSVLANHAGFVGGGFHTRGSNARITNSTFSGNVSESSGGGIHSLSALYLENSFVSGNRAADNGGGIFSNSPLLKLVTSTISANTADQSGGGLSISSGRARMVEISELTVTGNAAGTSGGGLFSERGALAIRRNLISGNSAPVGAEVDLDDPTIDADEFNLLGHIGLTQTNALSGFIPDVSDRTASSDGTNPKALAAILSPLALNAPGTTPTHALPTGSPAINAGGTTCSATDQRGVARPQGAACDVGAYEKDAGPVPPNITIAGASITEGNSGTVNLSFKVRLSAPAPAAVRVNFATQDGTARQPGDYVTKTGTLNIAKGKTSGDIVIQVKGDTAIEPNETFRVLLSNPRGASITTGTATGTIKNDDRPRLSINDVSLAEGNSGQKNATFIVRLSPAATGPVTVKFATADGTALRPSDYVAKSGTLNFAAGQTSKTILVPVKGDRSKEANETFRVNLSAATGASIADAQGIGTIGNDD